MPFQPFADTLADCRAVHIPPGLDAEQRSRFVAKVAAAVRQQAELARRCPAILRVTGEVGEDGERLLIPHEPASPLIPAAALEGDDRPDISTLWWLTRATLRALETAAVGKMIHGGIQLGALLLDETGRARLADFGIAPVFEGICGMEARRWLHCDAVVHPDQHGRTLSGAWRLLGETESRPYGWITPYSAHELLEGALRLNIKADQFALGVLLYLLATGTHPYGAALADPTLNIYFHLEPAPLDEERRDWTAAFEKQRAGTAQASERAIVAWAKMVTGLLASSSQVRSAPALERDDAIREHIAPPWVEACAAIDVAMKQLDDGDVEAFLASMRPWAENTGLPELWRQRLHAWIKRIDAQKEVIGARRARQRRLKAAHDALDLVELEQARQGAQLIVDDPEAEEELRQDAHELLRLCDEQEQFIASGADAIAVAYLEAAQESLQRGDLDAARQVLKGLMQDPGMPPTRVARARQLSGEVELAAQRLEQQEGELVAAAEAARTWDLDVAAERAEGLLADEHLSEGVATRARPLLESIRQKQQVRTRELEALAAADAAWEEADAQTMADCVAGVPADVEDPQVKPRRAHAAVTCDRLRAAVEKHRAAQRLVADGRIADAIAAAEAVAGASDLPAPLKTAAGELIARGRKSLEAQHAAALAAVKTRLAEAKQKFDSGNAAACRQLLDTGVLAAADVPADVRTQAQRLLEECTRLEHFVGVLNQARAQLEKKEFDAAIRTLDALDVGGLPVRVTERAPKLRAEVVAAQHALAAQQQEHIRQRLQDGKAALAAGRRGAARAAVREIKGSPHSSPELLQEAAALAAAIRASIPKGRYLKLGVAAAAVLAVGAFATWYALRPPPPPPPPPPTFAEAQATFEQGLQAALANSGIEIKLRADADVSLTPECTWQTRTLLPHSALAFDPQHGEFPVAPESVVRWFRLQVEAVEALRHPQDLTIHADGAHDAQVRLIDPELAQLKAVDAQQGAVQIATTARLADDPRQDARFDFTGQLVGKTLTADKTSRAALAKYVEERQQLEAAARAKAMADALTTMQQQVDKAEEWAREAKRTASHYKLRFDPSDRLPSRLLARADGTTEDRSLGEVAESQLKDLTLTDALRESLFPPPAIPKFAEAKQAFEQALKTALGTDAEASTVQGDPSAGLSVSATGAGKPLLPYPHLTFDAARGEFSPAPDDVAKWFRRQTAALATLTKGEGLQLRVDKTYDANLALVPSEDQHLIAVDESSDAVHVVVQARLSADPRDGEHFDLSGRLSGTTLTSDDAGRAAFAAYLGSLQQSQATAVAASAAEILKPPTGIRLVLPEKFAGGPTLDLTLLFTEQPLAKLTAQWDAASLKYALDEKAALDAVRTAVQKLAAADQTRRRLNADWLAVAAMLSIPDATPGSAYFRRCKLLDVTPQPLMGDDVWTVPLRVTLGPEQSPADERITVDLRAAFADNALTWDVADLSATQAAIAKALTDLAANTGLRARRQSDAVAELKLPADRLQVTHEGDSLTAKDATGRKQYTWTWDPLELRYGDRQVKEEEKEKEKEQPPPPPPPPPPPTATLAALAKANSIAAADFVTVLRDETARKAEAYAVSAFSPGPELAATDPEQSLIQISQSLQTLVAARPAADPVPVIFVEYIVGPDDIYAMSWHAVTGPGDQITSVADLRVWRIMSTAELHQLGDPETFRGRYSTDANLGERLLGTALGAPGQPVAASAGGSFGVVLAPQDALWAVRWEQVQFQPRQIAGLDPNPGVVRSLRQLLQPLGGRGATSYRRAGLWCVPALGGAWHGPVEKDKLRFVIGPLNLGRSDFSLRFDARGPDNLLLAYTEVPPLGDFAWGTYVKQVRRADVGNTFWNRGWDADAADASKWKWTPYLTFALLRVAE